MVAGRQHEEPSAPAPVRLDILCNACEIQGRTALVGRVVRDHSGVETLEWLCGEEGAGSQRTYTRCISCLRPSKETRIELNWGRIHLLLDALAGRNDPDTEDHIYI